MIKNYRINGFEQIKAFYSWVFNNPDKARSTHVSLYFFLVNQANRANWAEWFKCPYDLAMQGACIGSNGTYYRCLDELQNWGLIKYQKGVNNYKAPLISLIRLYDSEQVTEQVTVPLSEQVTEQLTVQLSEQVTAHIYKLLTNNLKRITDNINSVIDFLDSLDSKIDFNQVIEQYHALCPDLPRVKNISKERESHLRARISQHSLDQVIDAFRIAGESDFLRGISDKGWKANFDWILKTQNFIKVIEGQYSNNGKALAGSHKGKPAEDVKYAQRQSNRYASHGGE